MNWKNYSNEKKLKTYDTEYCHELNAYLKENDPEFFKNVVQPFIKNKIVKTFVDFCLLEDTECEKWAQLPKLEELNSFEVVLLVKHLMKVGKKEEAESIARVLELYQKSQRITKTVFNHHFDTVINAK